LIELFFENSGRVNELEAGTIKKAPLKIREALY
jgi:hypothetical protein